MMCSAKCMNNPNLGLLLIRLGLGSIFLAHGIQKVQGMEAVVGFFGTLGLPAAVAYLVAAGEFLAGLSMLLGFWTHWAGKVIAVIMIGAIALAKYKMGFLGGYEFDLMLLLSALGISFAGSGTYSFDAKMQKPAA